ncbi:MAG: four helix bundle protein [Saprospiraceae bacterium]
MRNFRNLEIWQKGIELTTDIYRVTDTFPSGEKYGLVSQITRSAVSIPSSIAEGCRGSDKELIRYLEIAMGSAFELETQLIIAHRIALLQKSDFDVILNALTILQKRINAFRNTLK